MVFTLYSRFYKFGVTMSTFLIKSDYIALYFKYVFHANLKYILI